MKTDGPKWIVNDLGELGVEIGNRQFFLYKGGNIEYDGFHDDGTPMKYRVVGKREFGECCVVAAMRQEGAPDRYTAQLQTLRNPDGTWPKLSADAQWRNLPNRKKRGSQMSDKSWKIITIVTIAVNLGLSLLPGSLSLLNVFSAALLTWVYWRATKKGGK